MRIAKSVFRRFQEADGRVKLATLSGVGLLTAALVLALAVLPASAGNGSATTTHGVQPQEISYGGGAGACDATISGRLPSAADHELHINNPSNNVFTETVNGVDVDIRLTGISGSGDKLFNFEVLTPGWTVFDVVVNGGAKNTHFDYDDHLGPGNVPFPGPQTIDTGLHAPTKGNSGNLYQLSHINICFDEIPEAPISGTVFYDDNVDTINNDGMPASGLSVYVIDADGTVVDQGTTGVNGEYSILVPVGADYLVCLGTTAEELVQTTPIEDPPNCADAVDGLSLFDSGFDVTNLGTEGSAGNDFGVVEEFCGEIFSETGGVFEVARFEIFEGGNNDVPCERKSGALFVSGGEVGFPVVGPSSGSFAAFGEITKIFADPLAVTPLVYKQGPGDANPSSTGGFEEIPWCGLRAKATDGSDGNQFDMYVSTPGTYPSLTGIVDPDSGDPAVACLVFREESLVQPAPLDTDVKQLNILLVQDDPQFR